MDVNSLPDEMLSSILKYVDFYSVRRVRKISQKVDKVARRAAIGFRIPAERFSFIRKNGNILTSFTHERQEKNSVRTKFSGDVDPNLRRLWTYGFRQRNLEHALSNVTVIFQVNITYSTIDNAFLAMLRRQQKRLRNVKEIRLCEVEFMIDVNDAKDLLRNVCPKLESLEILINLSHESMGLRNLCNSEVLGCRKWKSLHIGPLGSPTEYLNDEFLLTVAPKCQKFCSSNREVFTILGAIQLLKNCSPENLHFFDLNNIKLKDVPYAEVKRVIESRLPKAKLTVSQDPHQPFGRLFEVRIDHPTTTHLLTFILIV